VSRPELRRTFHDRLAEIHAEVAVLIDRSSTAVTQATAALLEADPSLADRVAVADAEIDAAYPRIEGEVFELVATQAPVARDLRLLVATLRIAQEIERIGDLATSVAKRSRLGPGTLSSEMRALIYGLGAEASRMLSDVAAAYRALDADMALAVVAADDVVDGMRRAFLWTLFGAHGSSPETLVELGLVARFLERLADHAVVIAERVRFVACATMDAGDRDSA
jgi:phosphate transport system protein